MKNPSGSAPIPRLALLLETVKVALFPAFALLAILYHATIAPRLWWYRRRGRGAEAERIALRIVQNWNRLLLRRIGCAVEIEGAEHIPLEGPVVVMSNHQSLFDIALLLAHLGRVMGFVSKKELFRIPGFSFWMREIHCVSLDRADIASAGPLYERLSRDLKERGAGFIVFPEGTRARDPEATIAEFKQGSLRVASLQGLPILPVSLDGTRFITEPVAMYRTRHGGRLVRMKVAPPIHFQGKTAKERRQFMEELRKTIVANREAIRVSWPAPTRPRTAPAEGADDRLGQGSAQPG